MTTLIILLSIGIFFIFVPFIFWIIRNIFIMLFHKHYNIFNYLKWIVTIGVIIGIIFIIIGILIFVL